MGSLKRKAKNLKRMFRMVKRSVFGRLGSVGSSAGIFRSLSGMLFSCYPASAVSWESSVAFKVLYVSSAVFLAAKNVLSVATEETLEQ